jgi:HlyD family secretion protein
MSRLKKQKLLTQISSTFPKKISEAKANLNQIIEVRPVDVQVAQAELNKLNLRL